MIVQTPEEASRVAAELWQSTFARLSQHLRKEQLQTWFHRVAPGRFDGQVLSLAVPSEFHRTWILDNYLTAILTAGRAVLGHDLDIQIHVNPETASLGAAPAALLASPAVVPQVAVPQLAPPADEKAARRAPVKPVSARDGQAPKSDADAWPSNGGASSPGASLSLNPHYVFENFVVGPCNRFACAGAMGVSEKPATAYNPLFLHGSVGLGKTHLLQAICHETLRRRPETRILFLSCETFTNHFIAAIEKGALEEFRRRYRSVDILVVDDIQFLANKERTQEEFFHTFNSLFLEKKQIVLSSDSPAHEIPSLQERLVSRFKWGLEAEIEKPCFETRIALLSRKARVLGVTVPEDVTHYLAERITNNIRELEGAINRIAGYSSLQRVAISLDMVRRIMPELDADRSAVVRFDDVSSVVAKRYHVKLLELQSRRRAQSIAFPRQVAMFLARKHTKHSLVEIGGYFGGRDHTTVLYGIEKVTELMRDDAEIREAVVSMSEELGRIGPRSS
jgi:chromosomal replication initiator protein